MRGKTSTKVRNLDTKTSVLNQDDIRDIAIDIMDDVFEPVCEEHGITFPCDPNEEGERGEWAIYGRLYDEMQDSIVKTIANALGIEDMSKLVDDKVNVVVLQTE